VICVTIYILRLRCSGQSAASVGDEDISAVLGLGQIVAVVVVVVVVQCGSITCSSCAFRDIQPCLDQDKLGRNYVMRIGRYRPQPAEVLPVHQHCLKNYTKPEGDEKLLASFGGDNKSIQYGNRIIKYRFTVLYKSVVTEL